MKHARCRVLVLIFICWLLYVLIFSGVFQGRHPKSSICKWLWILALTHRHSRQSPSSRFCWHSECNDKEISNGLKYKQNFIIYTMVHPKWAQFASTLHDCKTKEIKLRLQCRSATFIFFGRKYRTKICWSFTERLFFELLFGGRRKYLILMPGGPEPVVRL